MGVDELTKNIDFGVIELSVIKIGAHDNTLCGRYSELIVKPDQIYTKLFICCELFSMSFSGNNM